MIRIRGFARKTRRLTKGGSLPAPAREISARDGESNRDDQPGVSMGMNGHGNGSVVETLHRNGTSDAAPSARTHDLEHRGNGSNGSNGSHASNGSHGTNGVNGVKGANGSHSANGAPSSTANGLTDFLHGVVEQLVEPRQAIEGRPPLEGAGSINGHSGSNLETIFARATLPADLARPIPRWKRVFDISCIVLTLPIWLPLLVMVMAWIKVVSPGPIFYRQERVGYRGRLFMLFKFRTMHVNAETRSHEEYFAHLMTTDSPMTKLDAVDDSRLIRCGRLLRALGLDELPQLFNVLRGDMSLVGPRPCLTNEFQHYSPAQKQRVNAPPGLTGYWQVNGKNKTTFSEMIAMDIYYSEHMSMWLDVRIICKTVPALIAQTIEARARRGTEIGGSPVSAQR